MCKPEMRELTFLVPVLIVANQLTFAQSNWVRKDFLCKDHMLQT
ncbi:hypothetical protein HMPREF1557_00361 [Streptococcus sobrinus W1703]|uniref:Uncharacterized protein n=1 Tax=Streptococcus sobrinus W1703 TaxID=1227275 RepID=U2JDW7_9STRE|nr:hypothetical protein HMPREF1557_00361 [Streptococcus sobrinus W1703]